MRQSCPATPTAPYRTAALICRSCLSDTRCRSSKWHLGDFFPKGPKETSSFANTKWPVSHPGIHGFDEWHSTEASGPTSTPNCGCDASWPAAGRGCVSGGGEWRNNRSWVCMNYWRPDVANDRPAVSALRNLSFACEFMGLF